MRVDIPEPKLRDEACEQAAKFNKQNRDLLMMSEKAGCYYCQTVFNANEIKEWVDKKRYEIGETALCPKCGIDSVLPDIEITLTPEFLEKMHEYWFE